MPAKILISNIIIQENAMKSLMLAIGLGLALMNFSFADEPKMEPKMDKEQAIAECMKKPNAEEREQCKKDLDAEGSGTAEGTKQ